VSATPGKIWYYESHDAGGFQFHLKPDGTAQVWVMTGPRERPEIGFYRTDLGPPAFERLRALKRDAELDKLPPSTPSSPGMGHVGLIEEYGDGKRDGCNFNPRDLSTSPAAARALLAEARRMGDSVLRHPRRVLGGSGGPQAPAQGADGYLRFEAKLRSVGTEAVELENPLAQEGVGPESTGLRLLVEPGPGVKSREVISVDLTPQNVQVVNAEGAPTKERWLVLPPGEEVRLSIRRKVNASPGRYRAHVECRFRLHEQRDSVEGLLTIDLGTFEVVRAVKSK